MRTSNRTPGAIGFIVLMLFAVVLAEGISESALAATSFETKSSIKEAINKRDWPTLKGYGEQAMPVMLKWYPQAEPKTRAKIAEGFYVLGIESEKARALLMQDIHTNHPGLRLQVQWALGRVSNNPNVVDSLLDNMQNDKNPLFRDKAACALASDQIHLTERQKVRLYQGLIHSLDDPKLQVRRIAIQALKIQTGQRKGFNPGAAPEQRQKSVDTWKRWLDEYKSNL